MCRAAGGGMRSRAHGDERSAESEVKTDIARDGTVERVERREA